jgi:biopolymer transport protein ExbD
MNYLLSVCLVALTLTAATTPPAAAQSPVAAPALQKGISVELAPTRNALPMPYADNEDALLATVTDNGGVYFGVHLITPDALAGKIKTGLSSGKKQLYIKADARTAYANVISVLQAGRAAGTEAAILLTTQPVSSTRTIVAPRGLEGWLVRPSGLESTAVVHVLTLGRTSPTVTIDGQQVPWAALQNKLNQVLQNTDRKAALVSAEGQVPFGQVVHVIDVCSAAGFTVVLVTPDL